MSVKTLMDVYENKLLTKEQKLELINDLGRAINHEYGMNLTDKLCNVLDDLVKKDVKPTSKISLDTYIKMQHELLIEIVKDESQRIGGDGSRIDIGAIRALVNKLLRENNVKVEGLEID